MTASSRQGEVRPIRNRLIAAWLFGIVLKYPLAYLPLKKKERLYFGLRGLSDCSTPASACSGMRHMTYSDCWVLVLVALN